MKRVISCLLVTLMIFTIVPVSTVGVNAATTINYSPNPKVEYSYSSGVKSGTIRYIAQNKSSSYFNWNYWPTNSFGGYTGGPESECGTACISMALSYVGVNRTPKELLQSTNGWTGQMWGQQGSATSRAISKSTTAISNAMNDYINGNAKYSPLCVYIQPFSSTSTQHWVLLIARISSNKYLALNPWHSGGNATFEIQINGSTASYYAGTNPITSINQWYNPNSSISSDTAPVGVVDSITGKTGAVHVRGWAFDKDKTSAQIPVHVYIGSKCYSMTANKSRPDVHNVYGCGSSHGFEATIYTNLSGSQSVRVYALSVNSSGAYIDNNPLIGSKTVTITKDSTAPTISDATYTKTDTGYTVKCKVSDNVKIDRVQFPTWTTYNGQDDLNSAYWPTDTKFKGTSIGNGYYKFDVKVSDHNNEKGAYITDIYAYDKSGNVSGCKRLAVDLSKKSISGCSISLAYTSISYRAVARRPKVTIKNGSTTLVANTDYTVAYSNNINVGTATVTITGKGNYTGTVKKNYTITKKSFKDWTSKTKQIKYPATNIKTYWTMTMTTDGFKYKLVQDKDYTVSVKGEIKPGNTVKVTYTGKGNFKDAITYNFNITCGDNADGHNIVTVGKKNATYFAKGYTGDKVCSVCDKVFKKGKATAKLKLATPKVKIVAIKYPWGSEISVTLKKASKGATGYQVRWKCNGAWQYSDDINFNYWIFGIDESHLQRGKKHKVQVRAFVKSGSKKAYSNWTKAKTVKAK